MSPNPARDEVVTVRFTLAKSAPASLELFDITGRRLAVREVGSLGAGRHAVSFAESRRFDPGVYAVRLSQGSDRHSIRGAILK